LNIFDGNNTISIFWQLSKTELQSSHEGLEGHMCDRIEYGQKAI
jgi:hypothetical protein